MSVFRGTVSGCFKSVEPNRSVSELRIEIVMLRWDPLRLCMGTTLGVVSRYVLMDEPVISNRHFHHGM